MNDQFYLFEVSIRCEGDEKAIAALSQALQSKAALQADDKLKEAQDYLQSNKAEIEYGADYVSAFISSGGGLDFPLCFKPLVRDFPGITFIFDFYFEDLFKYMGRGRYFAVYEKGEKVYDADVWLEGYRFLNEWLYEHDLEGNFYRMDNEDQKEAIAKGQLIDRGEEITEDAVYDLMDTYDEYDGYVFNEPACNLLVNGKNFDTWSRILGLDDDMDDPGYGYEHYLKLKAAVGLPSFNADTIYNDIFILD